MPRPHDPLLAGLVDDAALFPPGNAPMSEALAGHDGFRRSAFAPAVGPFLAPASRVQELLDSMPPHQRLRLSLVMDVSGDAAHAALRSAAGDQRVDLVGVEAALSRLGDDATAVGADLARLPGALGHLEVPRDDVDGGLDVVATTGWHAAKYRTGGVTAEAFPTGTELAGFLAGCVERSQPFKLTAGLHHAVRTTTPEGFEQHGVLNVLVAVRAAQTGAADVEKALTERDGPVLAAEVLRWDDVEAAEVRAAFLSFGCCGVAEPLDELRALGVLDDAEEAR